MVKFLLILLDNSWGSYPICSYFNYLFQSMKSFVLICTLLLGPAHTPYAKSSTCITATTYQATPEKAFTALGNDAGLLLRRAMEEPSDAKAIALLQNGSAPLQKRKQQLQTSYQAWVKALSQTQREAFVLRMMKNNGLMTYMMSLEHNTKANARLDRNPKLANAVTNLMKIAALEG